jgi:hypothetical membrane protein
VAGRVYAFGAAIAWVSGALAYLIVEAIAAKAFQPHYSYVHNVISDLGVTSPLMNAAFCVQGTLFLVGAILSVRAFETRKAGPFLTLAAANAVGNILIATFHSGAAVRADGTAWLHAVGALLAIVGGNAAILAGSLIVGWPMWYRRVSAGLAALGLLSFMMFVIELKIAAFNVLPPAVWERCSVYSIIAWQVVTAILCCTRSE